MCNCALQNECVSAVRSVLYAMKSSTRRGKFFCYLSYYFTLEQREEVDLKLIYTSLTVSSCALRLCSAHCKPIVSFTLLVGSRP